jgi:hypothetical protein
MNEEKPKKYTPEEMAKLEKSRTISDAELLNGKAEYSVSEMGEKTMTNVSQEQKDKIKNVNEIASVFSGFSGEKRDDNGKVSEEYKWFLRNAFYKYLIGKATPDTVKELAEWMSKGHGNAVAITGFGGYGHGKFFRREAMFVLDNFEEFNSSERSREEFGRIVGCRDEIKDPYYCQSCFAGWIDDNEGWKEVVRRLNEIGTKETNSLSKEITETQL